MADDQLIGKQEKIDKFVNIGFAVHKAEETLRNVKLTQNLLSVIHEANLPPTGCDKATGVLLYSVATKFPANALRNRPRVVELIVNKQLHSPNLDYAFSYLKSLGQEDIDWDQFNFESGVGVEITREQVATAARDLVDEKKEDILSGKIRLNGLLAALRKSLKFVEAKIVKEEIDKQLTGLELPKELSNNQKKKPPKEKNVSVITGEKAADSGVAFPPPTDNTQKNRKILNEHLERTGGKVITRFPPEPNGYLHIGHAKSLYLNFGYAKKHGGICYLRYDDTNPEKECQVYIDSILENLQWLGHQPHKVTYASDYFDKLFDFAVELIKRGRAYVCQLSKPQWKEIKEKNEVSPYRDRAVAENLDLFKHMRQGKFEAGTAVLRMKMDMASPNPCMHDLVAYRIKYVPHPRSGDEWCIYPSYDFTHCLCDSIEDITQSMCTLEFMPRHESYVWLLDVLDLYVPLVWEFNRLNLTKTVVSKRKMSALIQEGIVRGWDDPRLPTLSALRRKGYSPNAINIFCDSVGVSRSQVVYTDYAFLEHHARKDMESRCKRAMAILDPVRVVLSNFPEGCDSTEEVSRLNHPGNSSMGTNVVHLSRIIYIDRSDCRLKDEKDFWGVAPGKIVGLRYAYNIICSDVIANPDGVISEVHATLEKSNATKPKGHIHWVAQPQPGKEPLRAELRLYDDLFTIERPSEYVGEDWMKHVNRNSLVIRNAYLDETLVGCQVGESYQFERVGFFTVDPDTNDNICVWNRTSGLKSKYGSSINRIEHSCVLVCPTTDRPRHPCPEP